MSETLADPEIFSDAANLSCFFSMGIYGVVSYVVTERSLSEAVNRLVGL